MILIFQKKFPMHFLQQKPLYANLDFTEIYANGPINNESALI